MKIRTVTDLARFTAERWRRQYPHGCPKDKEDIHTKLLALGPSPDPKDIAAIIGNDAWTICRCDECNESVGAVVNLGDEEQKFCRSCLQKAIAILDKEPAT